jgi:hypothetical protein
MRCRFVQPGYRVPRGTPPPRRAPMRAENGQITVIFPGSCSFVHDAAMTVVRHPGQTADPPATTKLHRGGRSSPPSAVTALRQFHRRVTASSL